MSSLPSVADHLSQIAKSRHADEADAFGRTAFNRYYYAAFLSTRELLMQIERSCRPMAVKAEFPASPRPAPPRQRVIGELRPEYSSLIRIAAVATVAAACSAQ